MKQYTFTMQATVSFDVEAETKQDALMLAKQDAANLLGGLTADVFYTRLCSGYVQAKPNARLVLVEVYDPEAGQP